MCVQYLCCWTSPHIPLWLDEEDLTHVQIHAGVLLGSKEPLPTTEGGGGVAGATAVGGGALCGVGGEGVLVSALLPRGTAAWVPTLHLCGAAVCVAVDVVVLLTLPPFARRRFGGTPKPPGGAIDGGGRGVRDSRFYPLVNPFMCLELNSSCI